jgi:hypothetical protein
MISVMIFSGMNEASSAMTRFAVYPRSRFSLQGSAIIFAWVVSWMMVWVLRFMLLLRIGLL